MLKIDGNKIYLTRADSAKIQAIPKVKDEHGERVPYTFEQGDRIFFRLKKKADDLIHVVCEKECVMDYDNNKAVLHIEPEDTKTCEFKEYRYEFELITFDDFHCTFIENQPFTIGKELETHGQ